MGRSVRQAAAIPFRRTRLGTDEVLLVSLRSGGWGFPKGGVKRERTAIQTARMETLEEAGVLGRVSEPPLGTFRYQKRGREHEVVVFALEVEKALDRWQEDDWRTRVWVPIAEAPRLLQRKAFVRFVVQLRHVLLTASQELRRAG